MSKAKLIGFLAAAAAVGATIMKVIDAVLGALQDEPEVVATVTQMLGLG